MFRLKANKTSLYKLVGTYEALPPMRLVIVKKAPRVTNWWMDWENDSRLFCKAFFYSCAGKAFLSITKREIGGPQVSRVVQELDTKDLLERGMVEEFTTAAERRQAERRAACGTV